MSQVDLGKLLEESGAILKGHFVLTSGRHSDTYFEKFRVLEQPAVLSALCADIAEQVDANEIDYVLGPTTGGIIIAFEIARQMGKPALYVEVEDGVRTLRRGAFLPENARCLVVDDVLTTGRSIREVQGVVRSHGAHCVQVAVLIDRSEREPDFGCPLIRSYRVDATSYDPNDVPEWLAAVPARKPGTRQASSTGA